MFFELKKKPKDLVHSLESHQDRASVFFFPKVLYLFHKVTIKLQLSAEEILNSFPVLSVSADGDLGGETEAGR